MKTVTVAFAAALTLVGLAAPVSAKGVCLMEQKLCQNMYAPKYKDAFKVLRKGPSQYRGADAMTAQVMYATFEKEAKKTKRCRKSEQVELSGFKPYFVMGSGKSKRAMMVRGKSECAWVKVK